MNNNSRKNEAILGLIRVINFGSVEGEDVACGLEEYSHLWTLVVPGSNIGTRSQLLDADSGVLIWNELRILTHRHSYLDLYELAKSWRPSFVGVSFVEIEDVELVMMWEG
jgi:hypothetical protein